MTTLIHSERFLQLLTGGFKIQNWANDYVPLVFKTPRKEPKNEKPSAATPENWEERS